MPKKGIDISEFQTVKDYSVLKKNIDFAIIRAGFGFCTIDKEFHRNVYGLREAKIPYGCYWFSYACTPDDARKEAQFFCELMDNFCQPSLPLFIDWEYDSEKYARNHGYTITSAVLKQIVSAFIDECNNYGYECGVYTNPDFIQRYFGSYEWILNSYPLWLACWGSKEPYKCDVWQYSSSGRIEGIPGDVDLDYYYGDLPGKPSDKDFDLILEELLDKYDEICFGIMQGEYGSGQERKDKLGKYYDVAQEIINQVYKIQAGTF